MSEVFFLASDVFIALAEEAALEEPVAQAACVAVGRLKPSARQRFSMLAMRLAVSGWSENSLAMAELAAAPPCCSICCSFSKARAIAHGFLPWDLRKS